MNSLFYVLKTIEKIRNILIITRLNGISQIPTEIYINEKKTCRNKSFFLVAVSGLEPLTPRV